MMTAVPISRYLAELPVTRVSNDTGAPRGARMTRFGEMRSEPDINLEIERAYRRGLDEGRAAQRAEHAKQLDDYRREAEAVRLADRMTWTQGEAAQFAERLEVGLSDIEGRIAELVARVLEPFLVEEQRRRAVRDFVEAIGSLTQRQQGIELTLTGPEDLLTAIGEQLHGRVALKLQVTEDPDVRVATEDTVIQTRLGVWMERMRGGPGV
ncbi:MAG: hypothetical protein ACOYLQ_10575 [Hyphomicrobiaceae bacterium]